MELELRRQNLEAAHNATEYVFHVASHVTDNNDALFFYFLKFFITSAQRSSHPNSSDTSSVGAEAGYRL